MPQISPIGYSLHLVYITLIARKIHGSGLKTMRYSFLILQFFIWTSCGTSAEKASARFTLPPGYAFDQMERILLPDDLEEISGIAWHEGELLAIEDESAIIYRLNPASGKILKKKNFEKNKDIEDLLVRQDTAWVLRSNGNLYEVTNFKEKESQTLIFEFPSTEKRDFEAIGTDPAQPVIWLFCKVCKWDQNPDRASFYKFDLKTRAFDSIPAGQLEKSQLRGLLPDASLDHMKLQPSAIAIHPQTREYFLLSSTGKWLMTLDLSLTPISVHLLDPGLFKQPEGITFAPDGTLYISNEAVDGRANILKFPYHR